MVFEFTGSFTDKAKKAFESAQEEDLEKIISYLKTPISDVKTIKFQVFDTREGKQKSDPHHSISRASARFAEMTIYRYWEQNENPHFPHEITHLVAHTWGKPYVFTTTLDTAQGEEIKKDIKMLSTSFIQEGLAIAVDEIVFSRKLLQEGVKKYPDEWSKENITKIPKLHKCINFDGFSSFENKVTIPFAASFVKLLLTSYGLEKFKKMYIETKETNPPQTNVQVLEKIYSLNEDNLLKAWKDSLNLIN